jgi:hypothetical protein
MALSFSPRTVPIATNIAALGLATLVAASAAALIAVAPDGIGGYRCAPSTRRSMRALEEALVHFQMDHDAPCPQSLATLVDERYLVRMPRDQWGAPLVFVCPGVHQRDGADITSAGRDGKLGTGDDIHSWEEMGSSNHAFPRRLNDDH